MASAYLLPSAVDYVRKINDNVIDNLLVGQAGYARLPSLYQRAYTLVHQTGAVRLQDGFAAPSVSTPQPDIYVTIDPRAF